MSFADSGNDNQVKIMMTESNVGFEQCLIKYYNTLKIPYLFSHKIIKMAGMLCSSVGTHSWEYHPINFFLFVLTVSSVKLNNSQNKTELKKEKALVDSEMK